MALPTFRSLAAKRQKAKQKKNETLGVTEGITTEDTSEPPLNIHLATRTRKSWIVVSSFCFFISVIFLILTIIGNTNTKRIIQSTYFLKLDLANIIPASTPGDIIFVNSLARSLGLHDFYQVGLWNFCEGYINEGITFCAKPKHLYWFNPVDVILNELFVGATIALPADINKILDLIKLASNAMFGFFITGICMNWVSVFVAPVALYSRWWSLPLSIWTFFAALFTTAGSIIITAMGVIFVRVATSQPGLNIGASIGKEFFAFMWIASTFSILGWLIHTCLTCCCASRRDVRTGRKKGRKSAYGEVGSDLKKQPRGKNLLEKILNPGKKGNEPVA